MGNHGAGRPCAQHSGEHVCLFGGLCGWYVLQLWVLAAEPQAVHRGGGAVRILLRGAVHADMHQCLTGNPESYAVCQQAPESAGGLFGYFSRPVENDKVGD